MRKIYFLIRFILLGGFFITFLIISILQGLGIASFGTLKETSPWLNYVSLGISASVFLSELFFFLLRRNTYLNIYFRIQQKNTKGENASLLVYGLLSSLAFVLVISMLLDSFSLDVLLISLYLFSLSMLGFAYLFFDPSRKVNRP